MREMSRLFSQPDDDDDGWNNDDDDESSSQPLPTESISPISNRVVVSEEPERDLFIPIFAIVSLLGLFGAYGYETLRLASRGELYLPWDQ